MIPTLISSFAAAGKTWEMKMLVPSSLNFGATARIDEMWQLVNFLSGIMYPSSFQLRHFCWYFSHSRSVPCQGPVTNTVQYSDSKVYSITVYTICVHAYQQFSNHEIYSSQICSMNCNESFNRKATGEPKEIYRFTFMAWQFGKWKLQATVSFG